MTRDINGKRLNNWGELQNHHHDEKGTAKFPSFQHKNRYFILSCAFCDSDHCDISTQKPKCHAQKRLCLLLSGAGIKTPLSCAGVGLAWSVKQQRILASSRCRDSIFGRVEHDMESGLIERLIALDNITAPEELTAHIEQIVQFLGFDC